MAEIEVEVCRAFRNNGKCRNGDSCKFEHSTGEPIPEPPRGQCKDWAEAGSCEYEDRCKFLHGPDDDRSFERTPRKPRKPKKRERGGDRAPRERKKLDEVCENYVAGKCRYGVECRRQHEPAGIEQVVEKIDEVCNNFLAGRCRFAKHMCRRQHIKQGGPHERKRILPSATIKAELTKRNKPVQISVTNYSTSPLEKARYIPTTELQFNWDGKDRRWEAVEAHDCCACILYHKSLQSLIFVKQFRPPVYHTKLRRMDNKDVDPTKIANPADYLDPREGVTIELVAGLIDKEGKSVKQHTVEEIEEEAGYAVTTDMLDAAPGIYYSAVGTMGRKSSIFYCEVDYENETGEGGGLENENITLGYHHVSELEAVLGDTTLPQPPGIKFAIYWFMHHKAHYVFE